MKVNISKILKYKRIWYYESTYIFKKEVLGEFLKHIRAYKNSIYETLYSLYGSMPNPQEPETAHND